MVRYIEKACSRHLCSASIKSCSSRSKIRSLSPLNVRHYAKPIDSGLDTRKHLVILGSGWAGYKLLKDIDTTLYRITVVSPRDHFVFTPFLSASAAGQLEHRCVIEPIRTRKKPVNFNQAWCDSFDFQNQTIECTPAFEGGARTRGRPNSDPRALTSLSETLTHGRPSKRQEFDIRGQPLGPAEKYKFKISYDELVISIGSYNQTFGIPGVREHAFFLKEVNEARNIRRKLLENFEMAALPSCPPQARKALLNVSCVGAGPTGVEVIAELHDLVQGDLARVYPDLISLTTFTLFDVAPDILAPFDQKLREYAKSRFKNAGVKIRTGTTIERIDEWQLTIKGQEKKEPYGLIIWSTGLKPNPSIENLRGVEKDEKQGRLQTDGHFRVYTDQGAVYPNVYAIGDCSSPRGQSLPQTAQCASQEATTLARILHAKAKGNTLPKPFKFSNLGALAYIGGHEALVDLSKETKEGERKGFRSEGKLANQLWRSVYWMNTLSWRNSIMVPVHWLVVSLFGRDIRRCVLCVPVDPHSVLMPAANRELTLALFKPDLCAYPPTPKALLSLLKSRPYSFGIERTKRCFLSRAECADFYQEHREKFFFERLVSSLSAGPCMALILSKHDAIGEWRRAIGPTKVYHCKTALGLGQDSLRGKYGLTDTRNSFHGSDSPETARREITFFFKDFSLGQWYLEEEKNEK